MDTLFSLASQDGVNGLLAVFAVVLILTFCYVSIHTPNTSEELSNSQ